MNALAILNETGAILTNKHIIYTSGRHGKAYVNKDAVYVFPQKVSDLCEEIAEKAIKLDPDYVLAPAVGAVA